jgi:UDP-N-acetylglucosamine/UDP-N-acetylgalactosamine diphosphorylase
MTELFDVAETVKAAGQEHLLAGLDELDATSRQAYLSRLQQIDWVELQHPAEAVPVDQVEKSRVVDPDERAQRRDELRQAGIAAYQAGKVAVLMVAGGQGTRLGHSGPKGCYSIGAHSGKSIYQIQAEKIQAASQAYGQPIPFAVMTSPMTDAETQDFFAANDHFGLAEDQVLFFNQGTVPSVDEQGKVLRAARDVLLENPDGHGGCHTALVESGTLAELAGRGIEQVVYIQVDNILAPMDDPELVGVAMLEQADVVTKVFEKANPDEKLGHLVKVSGRDRIIEYTELTPEQTRLTYPDGSLIYRWGSPAMHCWSIGFFRSLADRNFKLPLHRSKKPLKAWTPEGVREVTGWKNERFIFDLLPEAQVSLGLVADRSKEFAPVKNASGVDSAESAKQIASVLYAGWLTKAGVRVELPAGALIEISPLFAATETQFLEKWDGRVSEVTGDYYLEA